MDNFVEMLAEQFSARYTEVPLPEIFNYFAIVANHCYEKGKAEGYDNGYADGRSHYE